VPVTKTAEPAKVFGAVVKTIETRVTIAGSGDLASMAAVRSSSSWRFLKSLKKASLALANMAAVCCGTKALGGSPAGEGEDGHG
jgi:hypothetical protein